MRAKRFVAPLILLGLTVWAWTGIQVSTRRIGYVPQALSDFATLAWPPESSAPFLAVVGSGLVETLQIAFLATLFGAALSLPLGLVASRNLSAAWLVVPARFFAAAIRVMPSLLWALLAVIILGAGPVAGVAAMTFYTVGYLSKLQYETFEGLPRDALEAVRAMGVGRFTQAWHVALPEAGNALRSQLLFMLEYNVRASSIIGLVGAGGIGLELARASRFLDYSRVLTILVALYITVVLMDLASMWLRARFLELGDAPRRPWPRVVPQRRERSG